MCVTAMIGKVLLIVGGLNWGLVGLSMLMGKMESWNVVNMLLGGWPMVEGVVYLLVGVAAVVGLFGCRCSKCTGGTCMSCGSCAHGEAKV